ncbi:MAG: hypothetical protein EPO24_03035 [Bacteroidetes bacterium]|nr:MAG: hypothetical protein EPO24_03035 [Bacteroidota bacterium]
MRNFNFVALLVTLNLGTWILPHEINAQQGAVSFQLFYDELSDYGMWVDYPNYGYVWIPDGYPGFTPYATDGHWVFTDDGWTWVSDYPWGWATFHYGRWDYDDYYGWFWVPDNEWGPAWVSWRKSPGYYGWAPLRPGISIEIAFGREYRERNERWIFVKDRDITRDDIRYHYLNQSNNITIINNSTVIVNTRKDIKRNVIYIAGPDRDDVQRLTRSRVNPVAIRENNKPGQRLHNGELQIYRPQVQKKNRNGQNPSPSKVMRLNDIKPSLERRTGNLQHNVNPSNNDNMNQLPESRVSPSRQNKGKQQQPRTVNPPKQNELPKPRALNPPNSKERVKPLQKVTPLNKNRKAQPLRPKTDQRLQDKKKPDDRKEQDR